MMLLETVVLCCIVSYVGGDLTFPPGFKFGVASAAYQVEGAWNVSDKSESIWDRFCHENPDIISDGSSGDVACDSYHQWRRDIEMVEELGAHFYRFSIGWSRLLPSGFPNKISEDGSKYYSDLIDGLLAKGIEPVVTLYHWDIPQSLQDLGGWTNPLVADWFADYARVAFSLYGNRVKTWITINEPVVICDLSYNSGILAPGIIDEEVGAYLCNKNILMAHAAAWRVYDKEFRPKYHGEITICNHAVWMEPLEPEYEELTELSRQNMVQSPQCYPAERLPATCSPQLVGIRSHPIFSKAGGWPPSVEKALGELFKKLGYPRSNLPEFTEEEKVFVRGTYDLYALNLYTSRQVRPAFPDEKLNPFPLGDCPHLNAKHVPHPTWKGTSSSWYFVNPEGLRKQLLWLRQEYGDIRIFITENGYPNRGGLEDDDRVQFYKDYLTQVLLAIKDGVNVIGYTAWTIMDNFEWMDGYQSKFGLYEVDYASPNKTRTPRASANYYSKVIKANSLDFNEV